MNGLWIQIKENLSFIAVCVVIITALAILARLSERYLLKKRQVSPARRVSIVAVCAAIATVLHILDFPLLFLAPEFYKLDFSELPVMMCGFFLGPSAAVACEAVKIVRRSVEAELADLDLAHPPAWERISESHILKTEVRSVLNET